MTPRPKLNWLKAALALGVILVLVPALPPPAKADLEDAAMFYDELAQHGEWVDYENHGPVWHPRVEENWRPYTNGRWTPSSQGYVFETQEPWAWATYHYGNWMPTPHYGWVWVPGRTWYPNTVTWRTSPETAAVDTSYIGWAPIPPPNYAPSPGYYPPGGYSPGAGVGDLITAPFWIFARAAQFLLGFGQPYAPSYSYSGCGCLAPVSYVPVLFPRTVFLTNYVVNPFYPRAFFAFGPPIPYVARVTNIQQVTINNYINTVHVTRFANVMPPAAVINRNPAIRHITPPALAQGHQLPRVQAAHNVNVSQLGRPNVAPVPKDVPRLTQSIPKAAPPPAHPHKQMAGTGLPSGATQQMTPKMRQEVQKGPAMTPKAGPAPQAVGPGPPSARTPAAPSARTPAAPPAMKPGAPTAPPKAPPAAMKPAPAPKTVRPPEGVKGRSMAPNGQVRAPVATPGPPSGPRGPAEVKKPRSQPQPQMGQTPMKSPQAPKAPVKEQKQKNGARNQKQKDQ